MSLIIHQTERWKKLGRIQIFFLFFAAALCSVILSVTIWWISNLISDYVNRFTQYDAIIVSAGLRNGVDPCLLRAVIWKESKFDRTVIGSKGEIGLMQVMQKYAAHDWQELHHTDVPSQGALSDPEFNIEIGSWYLGRALRHWKEYNDCVALALCEYNAGYVRADSWKPENKADSVLERINIQSTRTYVKEILAKYQEYKENEK